MSQCVTVTTTNCNRLLVVVVIALVLRTTPRAFALTQKSFELEAYVGLELEILRRHCACSGCGICRLHHK